MGTSQTTAPQRPQLSPAMMNGNSFPPFLWKYPSTGPVTTSLREHPVGLHTSFSTSSLHCHVLLGMFALFAQLFPSLSQAKWMLSQLSALLCCLLSFWLSEGLPVNSWEIRGGSQVELRGEFALWVLYCWWKWRSQRAPTWSLRAHGALAKLAAKENEKYLFPVNWTDWGTIKHEITLSTTDRHSLAVPFDIKYNTEISHLSCLDILFAANDSEKILSLGHFAYNCLWQSWNSPPWSRFPVEASVL